jgi:hypothetical protein
MTAAELKLLAKLKTPRDAGLAYCAQIRSRPQSIEHSGMHVLN